MTSSTIRWGYGAGTAVTSVQQALTEALWAEAAGFESFWISQMSGVDPIVACAAIGERAAGLTEMGTSVVPLTGRHPLALAASAATAASATGNRFTLGIGPSHQIVAEGMYGESFDRPFARTAEFVHCLNALFETGSVQHRGEQIVANGTLTVEADPPPLLLAALGPRMLAFAGAHTAGTSVGQCGPKSIASHIAPLIRDAAAEAGRPDPRIVALVNICVTSDRDAAIEAARPGSAMYGSLPSYRRMLDIEGVDDAVDLVLIGSPDEVGDRLGQYVESGATDLRVGIATQDPQDRAATKSFLESFVA